MKIGLINPPQGYSGDKANPDLRFLGGIAYIEAALRNKYDVTIVDFLNDEDASLEQVADCDIIGLTSKLDNYKFFKENLPILKQQGKIIIVGGTLMSSYGLNDTNVLMKVFPEIDYGVIGEGDITIVELIEYITKKREQVPDGIIIRQGDNLIPTKKRDLISNIDDIAQIDYSKWPEFSKLVKGISVELGFARGCYGNCGFCYKSFPTKIGSLKVRSFSMQRIMNEIENANKLDPSDFYFIDESFTYNKERAIKIGEIASEFGRKYRITARVNDMDKELAKALARTGCKRVMYGIESFDEDILKSVKKNITLEQIYHAIECTQNEGIDTKAFFIVGLPGETRESLEKTIKGIKETGILPRPRLFIPFPGTKIYNDILKKGLIYEVEVLKQFSKPNHFDTVSGDWVPINLSDGLSDKELIEARDRIEELRKGR